MTPNKIQGLLGTGLFMLLCVSPVEAQAPADPQIEDVKKEIHSVKDGQKAIQKQLQEIRSLLRTRRAPAAPKEYRPGYHGKSVPGQ